MTSERARPTRLPIAFLKKPAIPWYQGFYQGRKMRRHRAIRGNPDTAGLSRIAAPAPVAISREKTAKHASAKHASAQRGPRG
jgi:hypothetical protein